MNEVCYFCYQLLVLLALLGYDQQGPPVLLPLRNVAVLREPLEQLNILNF